MDYATLPTAAIDSALPAAGVSSGAGAINVYASAPPALSLNSAPAVAVSAVFSDLRISAAIGGYVPNTTINYDLTDDDFMPAPGEPPVKVRRKPQADAYNVVQIECLDRENSYNVYVAEAKDQADIDLHGLRQMPMITCHAICVPQVARDMAQRILQRSLYLRNEYEFTLGWKYGRLEPMDLVSLTDLELGMNRLPVRITSIEEDDAGYLKLLAEDFLGGGLTNGSYLTQAGGGYSVNQQAPSGNAIAPVIFQPPLALTGTSQIWIGSAGGDNWGGAEIWVSGDNASYARMGVLTAPARIGTLSASLAAGSDPDTTHTLSVDLTVSRGALVAVTQDEADALATLCYAGGELLAYRDATLTSAYHYDLGYLPRGRGGSSNAAHSAGEPFMRLDSAVGKFDLSSAWSGKTLYVKLASFNKTGGAVQQLSDLTPFTYLVA